VPVYQYACTECGEQLEVRQSFTDDALTVCPVCAGRLRKVLSAVGVVFKGSGFYRTDSRAAATASTSSNGSDSSGDSSSESSSGDKEPAASSNSSGNGSGKDAGKDSGKDAGKDSSSTSSSSSTPAPKAPASS
jgi:putative FmdB family regulatory protein